jgi:hypothetical protein
MVSLITSQRSCGDASVFALVRAIAKRGLKSDTIERINTSAPTICRKRIKVSNNAISALG